MLQKSSAIQYLDEGHDNKSYAEIMDGLKKQLAASRSGLEGEITERVSVARQEEQQKAAQTALKAHEARLAKETELAELISMLRQDLQVNQM